MPANNLVFAGWFHLMHMDILCESKGDVDEEQIFCPSPIAVCMLSFSWKIVMPLMVKIYIFNLIYLFLRAGGGKEFEGMKIWFLYWVVELSMINFRYHEE